MRREERAFERAAFDEARRAAAELESLIADGPIVPTVTPEEVRCYLTSRYDFTKPLELDDVITDVEQMLRKWQVHVTLGLNRPK